MSRFSGIFSYGNTGSGKTYTLQGDRTKEGAGIIPRAIMEAYKTLEDFKDIKKNLTLKCTMHQLYMNKISDLFSVQKNDNLEIKLNGNGKVVVSNTVYKECETSNAMLDAYFQGIHKRVTTSTALNDTSSRSHLIFSIIFTSKDPRESWESKISFIDLAGSERVYKSGVSDVEFDQAVKINQSLSALFDVIAALSSVNDKFVPYRNNKLTMLLSDILGGDSKTIMMLNLSCSSAHLEESQFSIQNASRVKNIITHNDQLEENTPESENYKESLNKISEDINKVYKLISDIDNKREAKNE